MPVFDHETHTKRKDTQRGMRFMNNTETVLPLKPQIYLMEP